MIYDIIIVGGGAAGLFAGIHLPKDLNKLILEKTDKPGTKVLLSGGERANVSNMDIEVERDYFGQNKKALISIFKRYNQWDIMNFFATNGVNIVEEDRGRLILESGNSRELLDVLLRECKKNNCEIKVNNDVKNIISNFHQIEQVNINKIEQPHINKVEQPHPTPLLIGEGIDESSIYEITTENGNKYKTKNVIISSGGKSFFHVGTSGEGYNFAESFGINIIPTYRTLCGMSTKKDLSEVSGVSCDLEMILIDKSFNNSIKDFSNNKTKLNNSFIYREFGPMLFTHFGISGPIVHNLTNAIGEYLNKIGIEEIYFEKYILDNLSLNLRFDLEKTPKRLIKFFELNLENTEIILELQNWRSWKEAKATGGGIDINELDKNMQSKKHKGLFFIGEVIDITGKTGGFNLQWAWSSAFVCSEKFLDKTNVEK